MKSSLRWNQAEVRQKPEYPANTAVYMNTYASTYMTISEIEVTGGGGCTTGDGLNV
jgi:hypothetical protein